MTALRPRREVAIPHSDVLKGTFQQAEFAADISAVRSGKAPDIYKDAALFFDRTYITEGMANLLALVAQRLAGQGGKPVIQLQTAFGGGKTHTLLAVWHLATRRSKRSGANSRGNSARPTASNSSRRTTPTARPRARRCSKNSSKSMRRA
jgi:predicted AAA+ superfamily ATPase